MWLLRKLGRLLGHSNKTVCVISLPHQQPLTWVIGHSGMYSNWYTGQRNPRKNDKKGNERWECYGKLEWPCLKWHGVVLYRPWHPGHRIWRNANSKIVLSSITNLYMKDWSHLTEMLLRIHGKIFSQEEKKYIIHHWMVH